MEGTMDCDTIGISMSNFGNDVIIMIDFYVGNIENGIEIYYYNYIAIISMASLKRHIRHGLIISNFGNNILMSMVYIECGMKMEASVSNIIKT